MPQVLWQFRHVQSNDAGDSSWVIRFLGGGGDENSPATLRQKKLSDRMYTFRPRRVTTSSKGMMAPLFVKHGYKSKKMDILVKEIVGMEISRPGFFWAILWRLIEALASEGLSFLPIPWVILKNQSFPQKIFENGAKNHWNHTFSA